MNKNGTSYTVIIYVWRSSTPKYIMTSTVNYMLLSKRKIKTKLRQESYYFPIPKHYCLKTDYYVPTHLFLFIFYQSSSKCRFCLTSSLIRNFVITNFRKLKTMAFRCSPALHVSYGSVKSTGLKGESTQNIQ